MTRHDRILIGHDFAFWKEKEQIIVELVSRASSHAYPQNTMMLWKAYALVTAQIEKELLKKCVEIDEEIEQLKRCLDLPLLSQQVRDLVVARIKELEDLPIMAALSTKIDPFEGHDLLVHQRFSARYSVSSEIYFIGKYVEEKIRWRAIHVTIVKQLDMNKRVPCTEPSIRLLDSPIVFAEDSLAHFQNCPVPPPLKAKIGSRAQNAIIKLPTKGRLIGISQYIIQPRLNEGGLKWTNSKRRWTNVSESYRELPLTYPRNSKSSFASSPIFSKSIQNSRRGPYQSYSEFMPISLGATTLKHSTSSFFYLYLSHLGNVRNKDSLIGEMN